MFLHLFTGVCLFMSPTAWGELLHVFMHMRCISKPGNLQATASNSTRVSLVEAEVQFKARNLQMCEGVWILYFIPE